MILFLSVHTVPYNNCAQEALFWGLKKYIALHDKQYILYKQYSLENTIVKHNDAYDRLVPDNIPVVFGMVKQCADKSPTFTLCSNTNTRLNRNPVLPLDNDELPSFTYPKVETIPKNKRMKWNSIRNSDYCFCGNI